MILNTATITTMWHRREVSKCCRKNGADVLAQYNVGQVYKCPICKKINKKALLVRNNKNRYTCLKKKRLRSRHFLMNFMVKASCWSTASQPFPWLEYCSLKAGTPLHILYFVFSHAGLFASPWTVAHQAPLSMEFSRILEWVTISYSRGSFQPRDWTHIPCISCIGKRILFHLGPPEKPHLLLYTINTCDYLITGWDM